MTLEENAPSPASASTLPIRHLNTPTFSSQNLLPIIPEFDGEDIEELQNFIANGGSIKIKDRELFFDQLKGPSATSTKRLFGWIIRDAQPPNKKKITVSQDVGNITPFPSRKSFNIQRSATAPYTPSLSAPTTPTFDRQSQLYASQQKRPNSEKKTKRSLF